MGIAKRSLTHLKVVTEGWDDFTDAESADTESMGAGSDEEISRGFDSPLERLALGRGQQDIRRYLRPSPHARMSDAATASGALPGAPTDESDLPHDEAAESWELLVQAEAGSLVQEEAAALAMGYRLQLTEEDEECEKFDAPDNDDAWLAFEQSFVEEAEEATALSLGLRLDFEDDADEIGELAELDTKEEAWLAWERRCAAEAEQANEAGALSVGLRLDLDDDADEIGELVELDAKEEAWLAWQSRCAVEAEQVSEAVALSLGLRLDLEDDVDEIGEIVELDAMQEEWLAWERRCAAEAEQANEAAAAWLGLELDLGAHTPAKARAPESLEAATPAKRRRRGTPTDLVDTITPPRPKRGREIAAPVLDKIDEEGALPLAKGPRVGATAMQHSMA